MWLLLDLSRELVKNDNQIWSERFPCKDFPGIKSNQDSNSLANTNFVLKTKNERNLSASQSMFTKNIKGSYVKIKMLLNYQLEILDFAFMLLIGLFLI